MLWVGNIMLPVSSLNSSVSIKFPSLLAVSNTWLNSTTLSAAIQLVAFQWVFKPLALKLYKNIESLGAAIR